MPTKKPSVIDSAVQKTKQVVGKAVPALKPAMGTNKPTKSDAIRTPSKKLPKK